MFYWNDVEASRQLIAAVVTLVLFVVTAPRGRRWLARGSLLLLLLSPLPLLLAPLFPAATDAAGFAHQAVRFLALASLLQSLLLLLVVAVWERIGRPMPQIFLDVLPAFGRQEPLQVISLPGQPSSLPSWGLPCGIRSAMSLPDLLSTRSIPSRSMIGFSTTTIRLTSAR